MKKRIKLRKGPIFVLLALIVMLVLFIILISSCSSKKEDIISPQKQTTFITKFSNTSNNYISDETKKTITDYFDLYYLSMKELNEYDMMYLFSNKKQAYLTQSAINYLINYRKLQRNDLSLDECNYDLNVTSVKTEGDFTTLTVLESSVVTFNFINDIKSESYNIKNEFVLDKNNKIVKLEKNADIYNVITNEYDISDEKKDNEVKQGIDKVVKEAISLVEASVQNEETYYKNYLSGNVPKDKKCDHTYDREKAKDYALTWVGKRNTDYAAFDGYGGNCQNYASQVISSGGIPMDLSGWYRWKWYTSMVDESSEKKGRTPSWTGVTQFYDYVKNNTGYGLCGSVNVNYFLAEAGDVIQVGTKDSWGHSIVVVGPIMKDGKLVDILTTSNTTDRKNYPLSAYNYSGKRLIKIYGWNE